MLLRHFAVRALLACVDARKLNLPARTLRRLRTADLSPYPRLKKENRTGGGLYGGRPDSVSKPEFRFRLDYDFRKLDVDDLSHIFSKPCWEVEDMISAIVKQLDPDVSSMYDLGGRESPYRRRTRGIGSHYDTYGEQLGLERPFFSRWRASCDVPCHR